MQKNYSQQTDVSKQISTAGKEASGTGNMKFMLNGAPTFGTNDGANVEIVRESGVDNNFIFGLEVEEIEELKGKYNPVAYYEADADLKRVLDSLVDGTFDDGGTGDFEDLYNSLLEEGDQYFLLADFKAFKDTEDKVFEAYKDKLGWAKKPLKILVMQVCSQVTEQYKNIVMTFGALKNVLINNRENNFIKT